jgi:hypothetical protein
MATPAAQVASLPGGKSLPGQCRLFGSARLPVNGIETLASLGMKVSLVLSSGFIQQFASFFDTTIHCFAFNSATLDFTVAVISPRVFCKRRLVASTIKRHTIDSVVFSFLAVVSS